MVPRGEVGKYLVAMAVLSLPFLVMVVALHGLRDTYPTFHGNDEAEYHYPVIVEFIRTFPRARTLLITIRRRRRCFTW